MCACCGVVVVIWCVSPYCVFGVDGEAWCCVCVCVGLLVCTYSIVGVGVVYVYVCVCATVHTHSLLELLLAYPTWTKVLFLHLCGLAASFSYLCPDSLLGCTHSSHLSSSLIFFLISNSNPSSHNHPPNSLHFSSQFLFQLALPKGPLRLHPLLTLQSS